MTAVLRLRHEEPVRLDRDQLEAMYRNLGPTGADTVVNQALEELAAGLSRAGKQYRAHRFDQMRATLRALIAISRQLGLTSTARVARDVLDLSDSTDAAALAATIARLERIGESSLIAIWDLQDLSI
ncbi:hypothetical protein FVF75_04630 [Maritimibacter fusiformis]|uniref:Uncharacterized protein n=1 Tax=Maritimibacter fusiformis TaxID=2603819 RepID=A0A5D0RNN6_9RHOB|nr:hypothetical protein FVF75_04630 [Maritimibacter fusiformis]